MYIVKYVFLFFFLDADHAVGLNLGFKEKKQDDVIR